jgi:hypothetical protein
MAITAVRKNHVRHWPEPFYFVLFRALKRKVGHWPQRRIMKKQFLYLLLPVLLGCFIQRNGFAQGAGLIDGSLQYCEKIDGGDRMLTSPGEGDTKFVYKPVSNPKDSATAVATNHPTPANSNGTSTNAAGSLLRLRTEKAPPAPKETVTKQSKNTTEPSQNAKSQDDSILSFNFLYYIIEKYKLQDIVD